MEYRFLTEKLQKKIKSIQNKYLVKEQAIIPSLHLIQETYRDIPHEAVKELSHFLKIPLADIEGMVSFYDMFRFKKNAKNHIRLCRNLPCHLGGSRELLKMLEKLTGAKAQGSSQDGKWYIELVECIGSCAIAPSFLINYDLYDGSKIKNEEDLKKILEKYD